MEKYLLDILSFLRKRLFFVDGLVVLLFLAGSFFYWTAKEVGYRLLQISKTCGFPIADIYAHFFFLVGFLIIELLTFISWHHYRSVPKFSKDELGILFAPDFDEEVEKEVNRLFIHLKQEIKSHEIGNRLSVKRVPPNLSISSVSEARDMLKDAGGAVAIWGPMEQQLNEKGKTTGFSKISITFIHRPARLSVERFQTLAMSLVGRKFKVHDRNLISDTNIVARDIGLVVRNALGVKLLIDGKYHEAIKILGPLHADLQMIFTGKRPIPLQGFCLQVQYDLAYATNMAISNDYKEFLFKGKLYDIPTPTLEKWLNAINQAQELDPQNSMHYISKGIYLFLLGDIDGALKSEKKAEKLAPKAVSAPNFSMAFLYNFKGNLKLSKYQYAAGLAKKTSYEEEMISQCINFIKQSVLRFPERKQLRLALGVLELRRGSKEDGIKVLEEFLSITSNGSELQDFVEEAKKMLLSVKSNNNDKKQL